MSKHDQHMFIAEFKAENPLINWCKGKAANLIYFCKEIDSLGYYSAPDYERLVYILKKACYNKLNKQLFEKLDSQYIPSEKESTADTAPFISH